MMSSDFELPPAFLSLLLLAGLAIAPAAFGATATWSAGGGVNTNWSTAANWSGGLPGAADDVKFFDDGAVATVSNVNNAVDAAFAGTVASLHFGNTNSFHTTLIPAGRTLTLAGTNGLRVGTLGDLGAAKVITATITGPGGALVVSNASANIVLNQGTATSASGSRAVLDLSGLDVFTADVSRLGVGTIRLPNSGGANQRNAGALYLAQTNTITLRYAVAPAAYQTATAANALEMAYYGAGNNGSMPSLLWLGRTNAFFMDSLGCGRSKASAVAGAVMQFNPAFTNSHPVAFFRGIGGGADRVSWWAIGDMADNGSTAQTSVGTNDFTGGTVDAQVDVMSLARDTTGSQTTLSPNRGVLTLTAGTMDVNTLIIGNQAFPQIGNTAPCQGTVNVRGTAILVVNNMLELGHTGANSPAASNSWGALNIVGGTVRADTILAGAVSGNNSVIVSGGTLVVSNTAGTPDRPLASLALTNAALWLNLAATPQTNLVTTTLTTGGITNLIHILTLPVFPSYPTQVTLLRYSGALGGAGFNLGLGHLPAPASGFLVQDVTHRTVNLLLTSGTGATIGGLVFQQQPTDAVAGSVLSPAVRIAVTNLDGSLATNAPVVMALASGAGQLNGTLNSVTDSGGVATFADLNLTVPGVKTLRAFAGSNAVTSAAITVQAASPAALVFTTQPADAYLGPPVAPSPVVQVQDAYGNNVPTNGLTLSLALASGTGSLIGATNVATDTTGRATFANLRLTTLGTKQLSASALGMPPVTSATFTILNPPTLTPAFPGAEGAGAYALGGRGGDVYYVTNLNDTGVGSLRNGITTAPAGGRSILFKVSGNIVLASTLNINKPRLTIAGQTAPGDGICLQNYSFNPVADNLVVRHIRTRLGTNALQEADSMWINGGTNIIVDHCSASWSVDETLSATANARSVTVQWTFITESLNNSIHSKGPHGYGSLITPGTGTTYSWHHNLYAHNNSRNPRPGTDAAATFIFDFRNNVIYNYGGRAGYGSDWDPDPENLRMNYVGNYVVAGPDSTYDYAFQGGGTNTTIFQATNAIDLNLNNRFDGVNNGWGMFSGTFVQTNTPFAAPPLNTDPAAVALQRVLAQAGAMPWHRDPVDQRIAASARNHNGHIIDSTPQVGGWPLLSSTTPPADADSDGMPDYWELAMGLNPANANDRNTTNSLGYTRLEDYLNWLADPHALCHRNGQVDMDLRQVNGGATNLAFTVANGSNGSASLCPDGFTARFIPVPNYSGLADFSFNATDPLNASSFGPVVVGVLVSTTNAPNSPPVLVPISDRTLVAGAILTFTNTVTDTDQPPQTVTFTLLDGPPGASVNVTNGIFTWRPSIAQGGTTNPMSIVGTDSGIPSKSATQAFTTFVTKPVAPLLSQVTLSNGQLNLRVGGDYGPDYAVQATTNLAPAANWGTIFTTNSPMLPFRWTDTAATNFLQRFYRVLLGP